ncbi:hypothetical protein DRN67_03400 [Candidatus Micrarchaeota archaeon]|nr:MAG: hypothetical protein DRN67_03400 [Candidatus Micrarchaeota archaeon]
MKSEKQIMVVDRVILFGNDYFQGFRPQAEVDYEDRIRKNFKYMKRSLAEQDPSHKQPIGYCLIVNPQTKRIFAYQRSSHDAKYGEKRLQGKWSWGVGGHIEKFDVEAGNALHASLMRELEEEVEIVGNKELKVLGYINNDSDDVGKVHFGVLYVVETDTDEVKPKAPEIDKGAMKQIGALEKIATSPDFKVEEWSRIALEPLKQYLSNL